MKIKFCLWLLVIVAGLSICRSEEMPSWSKPLLEYGLVELNVRNSGSGTFYEFYGPNKKSVSIILYPSNTIEEAKDVFAASTLSSYSMSKPPFAVKADDALWNADTNFWLLVVRVDKLVIRVDANHLPNGIAPLDINALIEHFQKNKSWKDRKIFEGLEFS